MSKASNFFNPDSGGYTGYLTYTKGDNSSFTYGVQNELVVGSAYEAALGGATTIATPLNSSLTAGTYFQGTLGYTINWSYGPTISMSTGDNITIQESSRQQAKDYIELAAGYSTTDTPKIKPISDYQLALKIALGAQVLMNLALSAGLAARDTKVDANATNPQSPRHPGVAEGFAELGAAVGGNIALLGACIFIIYRLKSFFTNLEHRTNVTVHKDYVEMDAELPLTTGENSVTEVKSFLKMDAQFVTLQKLTIKSAEDAGNAASKETLLSASDITHAATELSAHYEEKADGDATKPNQGSQLRLTGKAAVLTTGEIGSSYVPAFTYAPSGKPIKYLAKKDAQDTAPAWGVIIGDLKSSKLDAPVKNKTHGILLKGAAEGDAYLQLANKSAQMAVAQKGQLTLTDVDSTFGFNLTGDKSNSIKFTENSILITFNGIEKSVISMNGSGIDMGDLKIVNG